ncbi:g1394 [Coccomyxa elongata]
MESVAVLDLGSCTLKAGIPFNFPSDGEPSVVVPTCVVDSGNPDKGSDDMDTEGTLVQVVERGVISHWEGLEALLYNTLFQQLGWMEAEEGLLVVSEPLFFPRVDRERLAMLFFEQFNVGGLFMCEQSILSLYSVGKTTGTVVDLGHGKTDIVPVIDGQVYYPAARRLKYGGQDVTEYLRRLLLQQKDTSFREAPTNELQRVKEACIQVPESGEAAQLEECESAEYELCGRTVSIGREGLQLGEALLNGRSMGIDEPSVAETVLGAVNSHPDPAVRKSLVENIYICGGGSAAPGVGPRLLREICSLAPPSMQPALCPTPEYMPDYTTRMAAWMGGAVLSKVVFPQNHHVSKYDYDEVGPAVVHKKCFV